jgi:hypothetical protein
VVGYNFPITGGYVYAMGGMYNYRSEVKIYRPTFGRRTNGPALQRVWYHKEPGKPQQNGRHERMHLTLKQEATRPPRENLIAQQEEFDKFMQVYNYERPHEGINNKYPAEVYKPSTREYRKPEPLFYPFHDKTITLSQCCRVCDRGLKVSLSTAFAGVEVGIKEMENGIWVVSFLDYDLGYFDDKSNRVGPIEDPFGLFIRDKV